jgi:transposase InsO family protein
LWSWDITKLKGPAKWTYFYLHVILDVFSRYVVGWMVAYREAAALAEKLIALLLSDLGVVKSHGLPHVSNDNPYSEPVQDPQVQAGVPRHRAADSLRRSLRVRGETTCRAGGGLAESLRDDAGAVRPGGSQTARLTRRGLDQQAQGRRRIVR